MGAILRGLPVLLVARLAGDERARAGEIVTYLFSIPPLHGVLGSSPHMLVQQKESSSCQVETGRSSGRVEMAYHTR